MDSQDTARQAEEQPPHTATMDDTTPEQYDVVDVDPYGWIAAQESDERPTVQSSTGEQVPVRTAPYVIVEQVPALSAPDKFDHAVAKVLPNGTLLVMRGHSGVPLKGYAPGSWSTFEHVGEQYHAEPQPLRMRDDLVAAPRPALKTTDYSAQEQSAADEMNRLLSDPARRTPPTFDADADDTRDLPKVKSSAGDTGAGGGVGGPKGSSARAASTGAPDRRPTDGSDELDELTRSWGRTRKSLLPAWRPRKQ